MKTASSLRLIVPLFFLYACASFQAGSDVTAGKRAFLVQNNEAALSYFQRAAQSDPKYFYGTALRQGIWSYVGRTQYATGRLAEAQQSLERALSINQQEYVARLYLWLTLARSSDRESGLKEVENGMKGIHDFINTLRKLIDFPSGVFGTLAAKYARQSKAIWL